MNEYIKDIVTKCYNDILQRDPDPVGLQNYHDLILHNKCNEEQLKDILLKSEECKNLKKDFSLKKCTIPHYHDCKDIRLSSVEQVYTWILNNYDSINEEQKYFFIIDNHKLKMKVIDTFINYMGDFLNFDNEQIYIKGKRILRYPKEYFYTTQETINLTIPEFKEPPTIIISRFNENIDWTYTLHKALIYNKGDNDINSHFPVISIPNIGREGHTYLYYIIEHYNSLPDYMIFSQANPFEHSPDFITLVNDNYKLFDDYQGLTWRWKDKDPSIVWMDSKNSQGIPPLDSRKMTSFLHLNGCKIHYELLDRNFNCVCPVEWEDGGFNTHLIPRTKQRLQVPDDETLLEYIYRRIGLNNICPLYFPFNFSGTFGVRRDNIIKHPIHVYENLMIFLLEHPDHGYILERMWALLFG